jgi:hypothetical protein
MIRAAGLVIFISHFFSPRPTTAATRWTAFRRLGPSMIRMLGPFLGRNEALALALVALFGAAPLPARDAQLHPDPSVKAGVLSYYAVQSGHLLRQLRHPIAGEKE